MSRPPLLRETIAYRPIMMMMETRELPSRRRSLWTLTSSLMAGTTVAGLTNEPPVAPRPRGNHPAVREIHKNAWLKRQTSVDKKGTHFSKKGEKFWVVFCVHDDSEAFLEFYTEPKMGTIHKPLSAISLNSCLHVSPSIVAGQDNEYQFAVTLQTEVIRLVAANWEQMIEWVESLQGKLREMNILSPKDNLYSKLPETPMPKIISGPVASTRDPNSPLPPTPSSFAASANQQHSRALVASNQNSSLGVGGGGGRTEQVNRRSAEASLPSNTSGDMSGDQHHPNSVANSVTSRISVNGNSSSASSTPALPSSSSTNGHQNERENSRTNHNNLLIDLHSDSARSRVQAASSSSGGESGNGFQENSNASQQPVSKRKQQISVKVSVDVVSSNAAGHNRSASQHQQRQHHHQQTGSSSSATTTVVVIGSGDVRIHNNGSRSRVESKSGEVTTSSSSSLVLNSSNDTVATSQQGSLQSQNGPESNSSSSCVSRVAVNCTQVAKPKPRNNMVTSNNGDNNGEMVVSIESTAESRVNNGVAAPPVKSKTGSGKKSCSSENIYEHIYIPDRHVVVERTSNNGVKCNNGNNHQNQQQQQQIAKTRSQQNGSDAGARNNGMIQRSSSDRSPEEDCPSSSSRESHARRFMKGGSTGSSQRSSSLGRIEIPPTSSRPSSSETTHQRLQDHPRDQDHSRVRNNGNRNHSRQQATEQAVMPRSIGNSTFFTNNGTVSHHQQQPSIPAPLQGSPLDALIGSRSGEYRLRRDDYLIRMGETNGSSGNSSSNSDNDNHSNHVSSSQTSSDSPQMNGSHHLPLKEQQVMHLQMEINHPGGVRVILRKKDCLNSIAFVDYLGGVWIAGWKQTQFPVLYYGFHVGDQILKVAGVNVQSSVEASRAIKMVSSMQVEFIIRRLPYGKVFALKRTRDGEPLGLVAEGGSGEISEVLPDGLAARYGLPPKGLSVDGQTPCNWYLTEVNNRPLSLMSKENEVKDRLNAVGKEISILVQPADLVKHLRKSLKFYKGFKEYVVG